MPKVPSAETAISLIQTDKSKILDLTVGPHKNVAPGQKIPKADAQSPPTLAVNSPSGTYLVVGLDIDAPYPSFGILGPILHWIQSGLTAADASTGPATLAAGNTPFTANYIGPAPPPPSAPHRYIFLLYEQPADYDYKRFAPADGKPLGNFGRIRWSLADFEKAAKLGPVVAANYFCSN